MEGDRLAECESKLKQKQKDLVKVEDDLLKLQADLDFCKENIPRCHEEDTNLEGEVDVLRSQSKTLENKKGRLQQQLVELQVNQEIPALVNALAAIDDDFNSMEIDSHFKDCDHLLNKIKQSIRKKRNEKRRKC